MGFWERTERAMMAAKFEKAKLDYERIMRDKGYWFENRSDPDRYSDAFSTMLLEESRSILEGLKAQLKAKQEAHMWAKEMAGACWQLASVYCVLSEYRKAWTLLDEMHLAMGSCPVDQWQPFEKAQYAGNLLFLKGELLYLEGANAEAEQCFVESRSIDESIGDTDGVRKNEHRLDLFR
jgi:tetratricopeptide (TPR) repeat protein